MKPALAQRRPVKSVKPVKPVRPKLVLPTTPSLVATSIEDYISLFYGPPGVGKTTFVNDFAPGKVLFLSTDRGTRFISALRVECLKWSDFESVLDSLETATRNATMPYKIVCIDHVDDWATMAENMVCRKLGVDSLGGNNDFGKGFKMHRTLMENYLRRLLALNVGIVFIAHEDTRTMKARAIEIQCTVPSMSKSAWKVIGPMADLIGYCGYRRVVVDGKKKDIRAITTAPREELYAKDRTSRVRPEGIEALRGSEFIQTFRSPSTSTPSSGVKKGGRAAS